MTAARPKQQKSLTIKQERFCNAYVLCGNATEAARRAGYKGSDTVMRVTGSDNLANPSIQKRIKRIRSESEVTPSEVIRTLANHLRADALDLFNENNGFDIATLRRRRLGGLIKKIKVRREVERRGDDLTPVDIIEVELHSAHAAANLLSEILGMKQKKQPNEQEREHWHRVVEELTAKHGKMRDEVIADLINVKPDVARYLM